MADLPRLAHDDRSWEPHLLTLLVTAFAVAASATLGLGRRAADPTPAAASLPATPPASTAVAPSAPVATLVSLRGDPLVPVRIADVLLAEGESTGVVLLADAETRVVLPVWVSSSEGEAVRRGLQESPPPAAAQLDLGRAVARLGAEVVRIEVEPPATGSDEPGFASRVVLTRDGKELQLDARTAEALALALATGKPVYTTSRLLSAQGIARDAVKRRPEGLPSNIKAPERL